MATLERFFVDACLVVQEEEDSKGEDGRVTNDYLNILHQRVTKKYLGETLTPLIKRYEKVYKKWKKKGSKGKQKGLSPLEARNSCKHVKNVEETWNLQLWKLGCSSKRDLLVIMFEVLLGTIYRTYC